MENGPGSAAGDGLKAFEGERHLSLESYRRNGAGVRTPVWFAAARSDGFEGSVLYVYTTADSGKVKRVRRDGTVRIAPCSMRGTIRGPWINATAEPVAGAEFEFGMRLLDRKYFPLKQILNLTARLFRRRERVVLAIRPSGFDASPARGIQEPARKLPS